MLSLEYDSLKKRWNVTLNTKAWDATSSKPKICIASCQVSGKSLPQNCPNNWQVRVGNTWQDQPNVSITLFCPINRLRTQLSTAKWLSYSPNGETVVIVAGDHSVSLWDTATNKKIHFSNSKMQRTPSPPASWSPDGTVVVITLSPIDLVCMTKHQYKVMRLKAPVTCLDVTSQFLIVGMGDYLVISDTFAEESIVETRSGGVLRSVACYDTSTIDYYDEDTVIAAFAVDKIVYQLFHGGNNKQLSTVPLTG